MSDTSEPTQSPAQLREYAERQKERADAAEAALAEAAEAKREIAFLRGGVDPDSPLGKLFVKGYDGDLTPDAVREAWSTLQPPAPEPPAVDDGPSEAEAAMEEARTALTSGGVPPGEEPEADPRVAMIDAYNDARSKNQTQDRAQMAGLQVLVNAAANGDERAIYDRDRWKREKFGI